MIWIREGWMAAESLFPVDYPFMYTAFKES